MQEKTTENPAAATPAEIQQLKSKLGRIFDVDNVGNLTLKNTFQIPECKMIFVRGGEFMMGDKREEDNPPRPVELTYNYFIGELPVTQALYKALTGKTPSDFEGLKHPVEQVNWMEAMDCCNMLNKKIGFNPICNRNYDLLDGGGKKTDDILKVSGFRLPTEAEWEYAARGGIYAAKSNNNDQPDSFEYAGSNQLDEVGWYDENNEYETKPVGLKFPNQLGIYDMSGNVDEWCLDRYDGKYYQNNKKYKNPVNLKTGSVRVLRGGSWLFSAAGCRAASRGLGDPGDGWDGNGFRLVFAFQFT